MPADAPETDPTAVAPARLPFGRWGGLVLLLLAEVGTLSAAYDAADRARDGGWAGVVVAWTPAVFRWALVAGGVAVVLAVTFLRDATLAALRARHLPTELGRALVGNLIAYGAFALATGQVLRPGAPLAPSALAAWLLAGALTVATWALAMVPARVWPAWAWRGRWLWLAAAGVAAVASLVARAAREEWDVLSGPTMSLAHALLQFVLPDVVYDPGARLLGTTGFRVQVGVPCSGYEGLGLMAVYLVVYLTLFRHGLRFPRAFLLVPLALAAVWVANVVRIVALVWIGDQVSPSLAVGGFHSQAGWVGFNAVALGLLVVAHRSRLFNREPACGHGGPDATLAYLAPLLGAVVIQMLAGAFSHRPADLYPARALVAGVLLTTFWRRYDALRVPGRDSAAVGLWWSAAAGLGVLAAWVALVPTEPLSTPDDWPSWAAGLWLVARVVGFVIITPLAEELAFRGYLMRRLISSDFETVPPGQFTWASFVGSSVLFGLMHGEWLAGIVAGAAYALVVVRTGRVRDAVLAHALTNGLLMVLEATTK
jgi:exosortase E/protease (VPEID-CTERM system)